MEWEGLRRSLEAPVLGTMTFGGQVDQVEAERMVQMALDHGISMFDTSNNYVGGRSEEILGSAVRGRREEVVLSTKCGSPVGQGTDVPTGLSRDAVVNAVEMSLRRLDTDYVDIVYLHRPDRSVPFEETLSALKELLDCGKVRFIGQSNYAAWQITELNSLASALGIQRLLLSQQLYNLLSRRVEDEYAECAAHLGLLTIAYNPLAGGLLTGKHRFGDEPRDGTRFSRDQYRERYWNAEMFNAVARLEDVALSAGVSLVELALRWVAHRDLTTSVLVGASSAEQLEKNLSMLASGPLDEDVLARCDEVWQSVRGVAPAYNR